MFTQGVQLKYKLPTHLNLIGHSMTAPPPVYHPAVFFRHLRLTAISFPHGKIRRAFQKRYFRVFIFYLFKKTA
jgi:hypothetical protein